MTDFDDNDDDSTYDDREDPLQNDMDHDDGDEFAETTPCPHCGADVFEQAEVCPTCGRYISQEDAPPSRKPIWIIVGVIACLVVILIIWLREFS